MKTTRGFYRGLWVALLLGVVWAPIAIAQPAADFFADYQRAQIGENVNFLDLSTGTIVSRDWDFGDGVTLNTTDIIVSHAYFPTNPLPVLYDVMLTVSEASASNSLTRTDYIEILSPPFARFTANTFVGPSPLTVNFTDGSVGGALTVTAWAWDFDDGGATSTDQNPSHTFNDDGTYDVTLTVTFSDASTDSETREVVVGTGEEQQPTASFLFEDRIRNEQCLLPLNDWVPVLRWNMLWDNEDEPAPRLLTRMEFHIKPDPIAGDRLYDFSSSLHPWDILEFAIFRENSAVDDTPNYEELSPADGIISSIVAPFPRAVFDPYGVLVDNGADINTAVPFGEGDWGMRFSLQVAQFNMTTAADPGNTYWLAVRTSATWHNALTLAVDLTDIDYQDITDPTAPLPPPTDDEGAPIDTVDPLDEAILDAKNAYLASFTVWDTTGGPSTNRDRSYTNAWNWPMRVYSPMAEYRRPRWDVAGQAYDFVTGEWLETRKVSSLDNWFEVIGLNLHGTPAPHWDNVVSLHEVNVILTDEGADPFGPPGSGGFNPTEGLETFTDQWWRLNNDDNTSVGVDFGFNGLWVFHDTDNDGIFDPPSQTTSQGVNYSGGDYPMIPMRGDAEFLTDDEPIDINPGLPEWQFVPFPPGGGPPWWKIKLKFLSGRRRPTEDTAPTGYLEPTPEVDIHTNSSSWCDYFVVVRPDSGYADVSQTPGDGTGMTIGADFKAFIEPRRFNANIGAEDGGIYVSTMIPSEFLPWQNDPLWGASEPWFPQRTTNQATTKPTRTGGDISDLIITYETNNLYARRTRHWYGASGHAVG
ncbi:MAG: PKD domain-containing protein, partial [bacterium]|nr:PKD domain-containing protein [bacterium]